MIKVQIILSKIVSDNKIWAYFNKDLMCAVERCFFQVGCETHPAAVVPSGSNQNVDGGNDMN